MAQYEQGSNAGLAVLFTDFPGGSPVNLTGVQIEIAALGGATVLGPTSVGVNNPETGYYTYTYAIPGALPLGIYQVIWTGTDAEADPITSQDAIEIVTPTTATDVGAQPIATIDAKGDLYAGTADDATTRLPVGTDGQVLRANSATGTGLEWDTLTASDVGAPPTTRAINTTNGLTGGGDLSADRTIEPVYGTTANTVAEGDDVRIVGAQQRDTIDAKGDLYVGTADATTTRQPIGSDGQFLRADSGTGTGLAWDTLTAADIPDAVPTTRTLIAGVGLSGGGDLSADRTFDVDYGTTAGTAAEGNDPRITGAQQRGTIDAKGDLYAGTGNDTTTRQAVGTDGQVLRANSATGTGLEWDTLTALEVGALPSAGGTMTGPLVLDGDPAGPLEAATKQYVDNLVASACGTDCEVVEFYDQHWWFADGTVAANQRAAVFQEDAATLASIFSDPGLTTPLANPSTTDGTGRFVFYAADGTYWLAVGNVNWMDSVKVRLGEPAPPPEDFQPLSTIDALGDLYVGIGPDATTRLGVGADGDVLTADSGEPTGMKWSPGGGGGAVTSVNLQVGAVDIYVAPISAVPASRNLTAGTGLSGGGDLSADRTFDVDYGTTAGTAAEGNDTRITGAQQRSTIDAKGDLYVGTANDATTRQPVGTDGQFLRANSGTGTGLEWDTVTPGDIGAVPTSRLLTAGVGLSGGGDLSADRTFDVDYGTTAGTAAEGNDARITGAQQRSELTTKGDLYVATAAATVTRQAVGTDGQVLRANSAIGTGIEWDTLTPGDINAVPTSRLINTQNGLQGGGDLSADRTLEPVYGTTANTVAQGNDTRIVNAIQQTLLDAKGDLIVATANDTPARQAVGANGQTLIADSAQSTGVRWGSPSDPLPNAIKPFGTRLIQLVPGVTFNVASPGNNTLYYIPLSLIDDATLTEINAEISGTAGTAGAVLWTGMWNSDSQMLPTGTPFVSFGNQAADSVGTKVWSVSQALTKHTLYYLGIVMQLATPTAATLRRVVTAPGNPLVSSTAIITTGNNVCYVQTGVVANPPGAPGTINPNADMPRVHVKF